MIKSKSWDWEIVKGSHADFWQQPSDESYYLLHRWKELGLLKMLDLGCGLGRHAMLFGKNGFQVSCFDLSADAIARTKSWAEAEGLALDYKIGDALNLPYNDSSFQSLLSYHTINHTDTSGMQQILSEVYRVLQPGGECYITLGSKNTWGWKDTDWSMVDENTKLRQEDGPENNVPHFYADDELIRELFARFNIINMKQIETFVQKPNETKVFESWHYHVLAQKPPKATI